MHVYALVVRVAGYQEGLPENRQGLLVILTFCQPSEGVKTLKGHSLKNRVCCVPNCAHSTA